MIAAKLGTQAAKNAASRAGGGVDDQLAAKDQILKKQQKELEVWRNKARQEETLNRIRRQNKQMCCSATKAMLQDNWKAEQKDIEQKCKAEAMTKCVQRSKIRREWRRVQDALIKTMANKIRTWHQADGDKSEESKEDLYQMLEASSTALKAQYFEHTGGLDVETGARRRAEKAVNDMGKVAPKEAK